MAHQTYPLGLPGKQSQPAQAQQQSKSSPLVEDNIILTDTNGDRTQLSLENGDLVVTALSGPNQGKKCNLTYGKWILT